jgi:putative CocE/NonD family hydrolase
LTDPHASSYARDWLIHDEDDDYWAEFNLEKRAAGFELPLFHLAGWYDFYLRGTMSGYFSALDAAKAEQFIVCGPWGHIPWGRSVGGSDLGAHARLDTDALLVAWFDHWLKDKPRDPRTRGATYFMLGENRWYSSTSWPPPEVVSHTYFLQSTGRANSVFGGGVIAPTSASGPCDHFNYDPEVPVLAPGGQMNGALTWGPADLASQQQSNNLLVYTSAPLTSPLRLAGAPRLRLFVRSTAPDTAFVARLSRVTRTGAAIFFTLGAARLRDGKQAAPSTATDAAAAPFELDLLLDDVAVLLDVGEALRLDLASSAFPLLVRHPNTLHSPNQVSSPAEFSRAIQTVYHDEARPSALELYVLPHA